MHITTDLIQILMLINFIACIAYFATRDNQALMADIPILAALMAWVTAMLLAAAVLGEFIASPYDMNPGAHQHVTYLGFGVAYAIEMLIMGAYWLYSTGDFLYNKFVARAL